MVAKKIGVFNEKGGVGKSFLAINMAAALAKKGSKTCLIDSDRQCNATQFYKDAFIDDDVDSTALALTSAAEMLVQLAAGEPVVKMDSIHPTSPIIKIEKLMGEKPALHDMLHALFIRNDVLRSYRVSLES